MPWPVIVSEPEPLATITARKSQIRCWLVAVFDRTISPAAARRHGSLDFNRENQDVQFDPFPGTS
jgi:hypothetical protein